MLVIFQMIEKIASASSCWCFAFTNSTNSNFYQKGLSGLSFSSPK